MLFESRIPTPNPESRIPKSRIPDPGTYGSRSAGIPSAIVAKNAGTSELMLRQHYNKHIRDGANPFDRMVANL